MKQVKRCYEILSQLSAGELYSWNKLKEYSKSPGRDVKRLVNDGLLNKVGPGLYLVPKTGRFGAVPASAQQVVSGFLKTDEFLLFSPNLYNGLNLGLTQLKKQTFVYNKKRHGDLKLGNRSYEFKLKINGFPKSLTKEFLLVDLVNNLEEVGEEPTMVLDRVAKKVRASQFKNNQLFSLAKQYGHVYTKKFFAALELGEQYPKRQKPLKINRH